jgi:GDP-L-fucose synthase
VDIHTSKETNVLVTGGTGLVGSSIPFGVKPNRQELDLLKSGSVSAFVEANPTIDTIIHAAGLVGGVKGNTDRIFDFLNENLMMACNVMDAVAKNPQIKEATFILSTCVYPKDVRYPVDAHDLHLGEPHPTNYGYAYAKRMLEVGARALRQQYGKKVRCIVPCNLYGPNDNYSLDSGHVIPSLMHKCYIAKRDNTPFHVWGSGNAEREFMYARDIGKVMKAIHLDKVDTSDIMIVSTGEQHTIRSVVELICKHMDFSGEVVYDTSKPEGILKKPTINDEFVDFSAKAGISLTSLDAGLELSVQDFIRRYPNVRK